MIALSMLNDWLDPRYLDHWKVQARLELLGLPPTKQFATIKGKEDFWRYQLCLGKDYSLVWVPARATPDRFTYLSNFGDLIMGARWRKGTVTFRNDQQDFEFQEPFQLQYPYSLLYDYSMLVKGPEDLEILWAMNMHRCSHFKWWEHRYNMRETFLAIKNK